MPILVVAILAFLGYKVVSKISYKNEVAANMEELPQFSYKGTQGSTFTKEDLKNGKPTVIIYFNSECEYCQHESQDIEQNIKKLKQVQLLFVSTENMETIQNFARTYKLNIYDNIHFLSDSQNTFANTFDAHTIPFILIYDKDKKLVKKIKGQTKVSTILAALDNNR